jgi:3-oxoacyl-ACP reductase-like protein
MKAPQEPEYIIMGDLITRVELALSLAGEVELATEVGAIRNCSRPHNPSPDFMNVKIGDWIKGVGDITTEYERQFVARYGESIKSERERVLDEMKEALSSDACPDNKEGNNCKDNCILCIIESLRR